ncbi:15669_t:CDS:1, partial [Funneliformis geosporum]
VLGFCKLPKKSDLVVIVHPEKKNSLVKGKIVPLIEDYLKIKLQIRTWEEMDNENAIIMETTNKSKEN